MPLPSRSFKNLLFLFILLTVVLNGCTNSRKSPAKSISKNSVPNQSASEADMQYPEKVLEAYLDSVGHLSIQPLADATTYQADSTFKNTIVSTAKTLTTADFKMLKEAVRDSMINAKSAKRIFPGLPVDTGCNVKSILDSVKKGFIYLAYFPFNRNRNKFDEFAIRIGNAKHCSGSELYYFKGNRVIAQQNGYSKYNDDLEYLTSVDGQAIFYQVYEFTDGSGVWWNNYFFYKYEGDKIIPVLNELENGNLQDYIGPRALWLESRILNKAPLTIKMVYYVYLNRHLDSIDKDTSVRLVNDSTIVRYKWDGQTKTFQGQFDHSKINRLQVLSYTLDADYNLFIAAYYDKLKRELNNKLHRPWVLAYLNKAKNNNVWRIKEKEK